jgi:plastocyanin
VRKSIILAAALAVAAAVAGGSFAAGHTNRAQSVVIKAVDGGKMVPNKYIQDGMHFAPGTVTVKSGGTITFTFADKMSQDPHTLTIVRKSDLPRTVAQVDQCMACQMLAAGHLKNPKAAPDQNNPIVHWTLNKGNPGLDTVGDSVAIQQPGAHRNVTIKVTAKPGTTLYFLCAVHPWMQGKIIVD